MRLRDVQGKRIVGVRQKRVINNGRPVYDVYAIVLEDGTELRPLTIEDEHGAEYIQDLVVYKPKRSRSGT